MYLFFLCSLFALVGSLNATNETAASYSTQETPDEDSTEEAEDEDEDDIILEEDVDEDNDHN